MIELERVSVELAGHRILTDVTVSLDQPRIAVIGTNGSGKSTFARLLNGLVEATSGRVSVRGLDPTRDGRRLRREVGFVFGDPDVQVIMPTVAEDIAFTLRGRGMSPAEIDDRVGLVLDHVQLTPLRFAPSHSLSGGEKQLLAVASVMVGEPELVVADEPTASLDRRNGRLVSEHLLNGVQRQLVVVTHDMELARRCDAALRFHQGRLIEVGSPSAVVKRYETEYR